MTACIRCWCTNGLYISDEVGTSTNISLSLQVTCPQEKRIKQKRPYQQVATLVQYVRKKTRIGLAWPGRSPRRRGKFWSFLVIDRILIMVPCRRESQLGVTRKQRWVISCTLHVHWVREYICIYTYSSYTSGRTDGTKWWYVLLAGQSRKKRHARPSPRYYATPIFGRYTDVYTLNN